MVTAITSAEHDNTAKHDEIGDGPHASDPPAVVVDRRARHLVDRAPCATRAMIDIRAGGELDHDDAGDRQIVEHQAAAKPGLQQLGGFLARIGHDLGYAGERRARYRLHPSPRRSILPPSTGLIWIVTSRRISACQSAALHAHQHHRAGGQRCEKRHDRNHRDQRATADRLMRHDRRFHFRQRRVRRPLTVGRLGCALLRCASHAISVVKVQASAMKHKAARVKLIHQADVMGRDHNRRAGFVQLLEQMQQPLAEAWIDIARRLIRKQEMRPRILPRVQWRRAASHRLTGPAAKPTCDRLVRPIAGARSPRTR